MKRVDDIITASNFMKKEIVNFFNSPEDRISVINLGLEERFLKKATKNEIQT